MIMADNEFCEDIDFNFFDSGDGPSTTGKPNDNKCGDEEKEDKEKESGLKFSPCGESEESKNVCNVEEKDGKNKTEHSVQLGSVDFSADISKETDKNNLWKEVTSSKEEKCMNLRELMNCIAYDESKGKGDVISKVQSLLPDFLSLSTDTTSEITDVTTPSSSGCSSMSKHETGEHLSEKSNKNAEKKQQKCDKLAAGSTGTSMKLLSDALHYFDRQKRKSVTSSILSTNQNNRLGRKNMSFSNEQYWKIKRENEILDAKLKVLSKQRPKQPFPTASQPRLSSSAINRWKQQAKIDHDNMVSTLNDMSPVNCNKHYNFIALGIEIYSVEKMSKWVSLLHWCGMSSCC
jgi:hypothetical protein